MNDCAYDLDLNELFHNNHQYEKFDSKTRKIMQLCQLNLLTIDYPMILPNNVIGTCQKSRDLWLQVIWI